MDIPFTFSILSTPLFVQPPPEKLPTLPVPVQEMEVDSPPHTSSPYLQIMDCAPHDPPISDYTDSSNCPSPGPGFLSEDIYNELYSSSGFYSSPVDQPPSSAFQSEASSAIPSEASSTIPSETSSAILSETGSPLVSDSELQAPSSAKATKQTSLLDYFSKVPPEQHHANWWKRKQDNEEKDREEFEMRKKREETEQLHKKARRREQNRVAQSKQREKRRKEAKTKLRDTVQHDSSVSSFSYIQPDQWYTHKISRKHLHLILILQDQGLLPSHALRTLLFQHSRRKRRRKLVNHIRLQNVNLWR